MIPVWLFVSVLLLCLVVFVVQGVHIAHLRKMRTSAVQFSLNLNERTELEQLRYRVDRLDKAAQGILPFLPAMTSDSFDDEDIAPIDRARKRAHEVQKNAALVEFTSAIRKPQTLEESASAYERTFGYTSAQGVAAAEVLGGRAFPADISDIGERFRPV